MVRGWVKEREKDREWRWKVRRQTDRLKGREGGREACKK